MPVRAIILIERSICMPIGESRRIFRQLITSAYYIAQYRATRPTILRSIIISALVIGRIRADGKRFGLIRADLSLEKFRGFFFLRFR